MLVVKYSNFVIRLLLWVTFSLSPSGWDFPSKHWLALTSILLIAGAAGVAVPIALRVTASKKGEE